MCYKDIRITCVNTIKVKFVIVLHYKHILHVLLLNFIIQNLFFIFYNDIKIKSKTLKFP